MRRNQGESTIDMEFTLDARDATPSSGWRNPFLAAPRQNTARLDELQTRPVRSACSCLMRWACMLDKKESPIRDSNPEPLD